MFIQTPRAQRLCAVALVIAAAGSVIAGPSVLDLKSGRFDTARSPSLLNNGAVRAGARYVIQLDGPPNQARLDAIRAAGVVVGDYLPDHAYVVQLDAAQLRSLRGAGVVQWLGEFRREWKLDPELGRAHATAERQELDAAGRAKVIVLTFADADPHPIAVEIGRIGGQVDGIEFGGDRAYIDAVIPLAAAARLAALDEVQYVEDAPEGTLRNDSNRWILQSNVTNQTPVWDRGIHGEGQIAGLIDGTPRESHCMFDDSVAPGPAHRKLVGWRNAGGSDSHGTHTGGTIAGDATPFNVYTANDGIAYAGKISFSNLSNVFNNPSTLLPRLVDAHNDGARVHSNSWGNDGTTAYTTWCEQIDRYTWQNEDGVVAFAVTNQNTLKTPENSINVLAVGASQDAGNQDNFCSGGQGPTVDGRRKPEIYAPGCNTTSANSATTCGVTTSTGTSMACPAITGAGLLARQYFAEGWYPSGVKTPSDAFVPSGALIRAALLNGTVDMTGISGYPSNREGWGRLLLDNALYFSGNASKMYVVDVRNVNGLTTGQTRTYYFYVNSAAQPVRATLVFTGPPAAVNASNPVINDVSMEVLAPDASTYRGNVFSGGQSATGGTSDVKNNVEQVLRNVPVVGWYTITVRAGTVGMDKQGYAIVVTGDIVGGCEGATITTPPAQQTVDVGEPATFTVSAAGTAPIAYQWKKDGADISGATSDTYSIPSTVYADRGDYSVSVTNFCGNTTSTPVALTIICPADFNRDGFVSGDDYDAFVDAFEAGFIGADFNGDGFVNGDDFDEYSAAFDAGEC